MLQLVTVNGQNVDRPVVGETLSIVNVSINGEIAAFVSDFVGDDEYSLDESLIDQIVAREITQNADDLGDDYDPAAISALLVEDFGFTANGDFIRRAA